MLYSIAKFILIIILNIFFSLNIYGIENLNYEKPLVVCGNHRHFMDPIIASITYGEKIRWMAKKELFKIPVVKSLIKAMNAFPIDRDSLDMKSLREALKIIKSGEVLGIFPEGTRLDHDDIEQAKSGVALLTVRSNAYVQPFKIVSNYKLFSKIDIYWGKPFKLKKDDGDYDELAKFILQRIYHLDEGDYKNED